MAGRPGAVESKAIHLPSGDQRGEPTLGPAKEVTWRGFWPLLSAIQISSEPVRGCGHPASRQDTNRRRRRLCCDRGNRRKELYQRAGRWRRWRRLRRRGIRGDAGGGGGYQGGNGAEVGYAGSGRGSYIDPAVTNLVELVNNSGNGWITINLVSPATSTPEPASWALLALGFLAIPVRRKRR